MKNEIIGTVDKEETVTINGTTYKKVALRIVDTIDFDAADTIDKLQHSNNIKQHIIDNLHAAAATIKKNIEEEKISQKMELVIEVHQFKYAKDLKIILLQERVIKLQSNEQYVFYLQKELKQEIRLIKEHFYYKKKDEINDKVEETIAKAFVNGKEVMHQKNTDIAHLKDVLKSRNKEIKDQDEIIIKAAILENQLKDKVNELENKLRKLESKK
jgi:hypothetical protein